CIASRSPVAIRPISTSSDFDCIAFGRRTREFSRRRLLLGSRFCHRGGAGRPPSVLAARPEPILEAQYWPIRGLMELLVAENFIIQAASYTRPRGRADAPAMVLAYAAGVPRAAHGC